MDRKNPLAQSPASAASVLSIELIGYPNAPATRQQAIRQELRGLLQSSTESIPSSARHVRDTDNGAIIAFLTNPQHAAYVALAMVRKLRVPRNDGAIGINQFRIGLHFGVIRETAGIESRTTYTGEGVRTARQLMELAVAGSALASQAFFDALADLDHESERLFGQAGTLNTAEGRALAFHALDADTAVFEQLEKTVCSSATEAIVDSPIGMGSSFKQIGEFIKMWFIPVNTVLVFGSFSISLIGKFTDQVRAVQSIAAALIALALIVGLFKLGLRIPSLKRRMTRHPKTLKTLAGWHLFSLTLISAVLLATTAMILGPGTETIAKPALSDAAPAKVAPTQITGVTALIRMEAPVAVTPASPATTPKIPSTGSTALGMDTNSPTTKLLASKKTDRESQRSAAVFTPPVGATHQPDVKPASVRPSRCALILQKAAVDEQLSVEDRQFLTSACQ